jgi:UrcA family protein
MVGARAMKASRVTPTARSAIHGFFTRGWPLGSRVAGKLQPSPTVTGGLMKTFAIACATLLTGCLAATAQATVSRDVPREVVRYADLNLQSEADAAILVDRIEIAARKVCGLRSASPLPLEIVARLRVCAKEATARAIADVNAPTVLRHQEIVVRNTME